MTCKSFFLVFQRMEGLICPEGAAFNIVLVFYPVQGVGVFFVTLSLSLFFLIESNLLTEISATCFTV